ncbi:TonB-dependent receptor [Pelomonas sp. SE-A7]|uniref:TonB-dependent receptor n=1 Tax=Pelomonas sp. SE-A7 TaxID=3054953 RepID=UPI00259C77E9|nr:TonB-dependent receptor [Pelomonas sp. SE-A7]MDM4767145.1 TonB-dependent receptor [Pelomonas sp. SE-A7]
MKPAKRSSALMRQSILAAAASLCMASVAMAQSAEGSVFGRANAGTTVTIVNLETGLKRQVTVDAGGAFNVGKLPPGRYQISGDGQTREVQVNVGTGTEVRLGAESLERVDVVGSRLRTTIDVSSVESNTVLTAKQIEALPVARSVNAVALLAPGVVAGDAGIGDGTLPSFSGASVAENGYFINGLDVTNIRNFTSYARLPFDAIAQQQIKSGGYGAEFGRSLGGVVNLVSKRGTNEWKSGVSVYFEPSAMRSSGTDVLDKEPDRPNAYYLFQSANTRSSTNYNLYAGGPIIKDKLFVFGLIEGRNTKTETYGTTQSTITQNTRPNSMIKVDFTPTDDHRFELTAIDTKGEVEYTDFKNAKNYSLTHDGAGAKSKLKGGGDVGILRYTGYMTDSLTVSALYGRVNDYVPVWSGARTGGAECPTVFEVGALQALGCWVEPFPGTPGRDPLAPPDRDLRVNSRLDLEYNWGTHTIRAGMDNVKFTSWQAGGSAYSGGQYWRYFVTPAAGGSVAGVVLPGNTPYVRLRTSDQTSGSYDLTNNTIYAEDSWQATKNLLLYGGVRAESFDNMNSAGVSFIKADNLIAPRLGFAWNMNGDSSMKLYGNAGRYYIPVASNTNIRATRAESSIEAFYRYTARDAKTGAPTGITQIGTTTVNQDGRQPDPRTIAATNLNPMSQDEFILGFQKMIAKGWTAGVKGTYRVVQNGMDDFCGHYPMVNWAKDNGKTKFDSHTLAPCLMVNPGNDVSVAMDVENNGTYSVVTIPAKYFNLAKYERKYSALELSLEKPFDGKWGMNASYVYSKSKGTAEGYVQSTLNQEDAGLTQDFDFGSFTDGAYGYLPNDRRHVLKIFGNYAVTDEIRMGFNATMSSGRPYSCIGFVPKTVPDYDETWKSSPSSYYCRSSTTTVSLVPRGSAGRTPWSTQLDMQLAYTPKWASNKLTLQADVFNLLNSQKPLELNETRDYDQATGITPPYRLNQNYLSPSRFQTPRYVRLTARYEF